MTKLFYLNKKKIILLIMLEIIAIILHNILSALLKTDEPISFIIATLLIPFYFIISLAYTLIKSKKTRKNKK